ncbi:114L [Cherax quadricarinatus iridovirus]|uniref:Proliferating cell nuclear antigen n=1 Tax=Shrimp hemocyte iridescent virus TaxID=2039780 RepID=A0A291B0N0_9VIRU|nr:114L [Cherax quadricarinatus iridovirus]YP_010084792.1 proliferating cell nuclear antigen [Shrimp hemocyte iridescent virus]UPA43424.1 proliferating cell nuclear antigen [Iridovirus CN01]ASZ85094.1 114L [Cherax quadricarinatus iridovirus]ATE87049.1 proliferating cell nuclear antigen [Shrimp hemocyte iridescent virus]UPA43500.1 proliferating cell nuclear antigen [Iridovirus CN01]UPA43696.1 proliferating cell nuclear antigen [Iridovirus CN01]
MFRAVTKNTNKFKALFEFLFQNMTTADFTIDETGMHLENLTTQNILISLFLPAENFTEYTFTYKEPIHIGLANHINKEFFKSVKNKDKIIMSITKPYVFDLEKMTEKQPAKKNKNVEDIPTPVPIVHSLSVHVEETQNIIPNECDDLESDPVLLPSSSFVDWCKSISNTNLINVTKSFGQIKFQFDTCRSVKTLKFGEENQSDVESVYHQFTSEQFSRISKINSFVTEHIQVKFEPRKPLYFMCKSSVGHVKIFFFPKINE